MQQQNLFVGGKEEEEEEEEGGGEKGDERGKRGRKRLRKWPPHRKEPATRFISFLEPQQPQFFCLSPAFNDSPTKNLEEMERKRKLTQFIIGRN